MRSAADFRADVLRAAAFFIVGIVISILAMGCKKVEGDSRRVTNTIDGHQIEFVEKEGLCFAVAANTSNDAIAMVEIPCAEERGVPNVPPLEPSHVPTP